MIAELRSRIRTRTRVAMLHVLARALGSPSAQVQAALNNLFATSIGDIHPVTPGQLQANQSWAFATNRQLAGRAVRVLPTLEMVQRRAGGQPARSPIYDHPFLKLLRHPNLDETGTQFHWKQITQLNTAGRVYVLVEPEVIDLSGASPALVSLLGNMTLLTRIARLTLLEPDRVRVISAPGRKAAAYEYHPLLGQSGSLGDNGRIVYQAAPATYAEREAWKTKPTPFVFRIFLPAPDSWNGEGPIEAGQWAMNTLFGLTQLWQNQLKNGLHAGLIFKLKNKNIMAEVERFEKAVAIVKAGIGRAGEPLILPDDGVEVDKSPLSMADMQFENLSNLARKEVHGVLGGADGLVGIAEAYNRANIDGIERIAAIGTVDPLNSLIADAYNAHVLPLYAGQSDTTWYEISYKSCAVVDDVTTAERLGLLVRFGVLTPNEAREEIGKPHHKDGDSLGGASGPKGLMGGAGKVPGMSLGGLNGGGGSLAEGAAGAIGEEAPRSKRTDVPAADPAPAAAAETAAVTVWRVPATHGLATLADVDERRAKWRALQQTRRTAERRLRRELLPVFNGWRDAVIAALRTQGAAALLRSGALRDDSNPSGSGDTLAAGAWVGALATAYSDWADPWVRQVIRRVLEDYGLTDSEIDTLSEDAWTALERFVESRARAMAEQVAGTQAELTQRALEDAVADGLTLTDIEAAITDAFPGGIDDPILRRIGATETTIANGRAVHDTAFAIGDFVGGAENGGQGVSGQAEPRVGLQWLSRRDDKVRDTHVEADGQIVPLDGIFTVGGAQMRFPGDDSLGAPPSEIVNCRCEAVVVPIEAAS